MKSLGQSLFTLILLSTWVFSASLTEKYPSYSYVFSEFDVDESFIYDSNFHAFVKKNEKKIGRFYKRSLKRGEALLPMVQSQLIDNDLSDLLVYISLVESGFTTDIVSSKKAVGLWQFMPATAKHYKLQVCNGVDERCDPDSSTKAAATYLSKLHKQFGQWYLAVMAYNCGEGRLAKAIKKAGSDELSILINEESKYLPRETRNYIKKILLVAMIGENEILDFDPQEQQKKNALFDVEVKGGSSLKSIAVLLEMPTATLRKLNRQYKNGKLPTEEERYKIVIPEDKMMLFYMKYDFQEKPKTFKPYMLSYYIVLGDTLALLAKKFETSVEEIRYANKLNDDALTLDTLLLIPVTEEMFEERLSE